MSWKRSTFSHRASCRASGTYHQARGYTVVRESVSSPASSGHISAASILACSSLRSGAIHTIFSTLWRLLTRSFSKSAVSTVLLTRMNGFAARMVQICTKLKAPIGSDTVLSEVRTSKQKTYFVVDGRTPLQACMEQNLESAICLRSKISIHHFPLSSTGSQCPSLFPCALCSSASA